MTSEAKCSAHTRTRTRAPGAALCPAKKKEGKPSSNLVAARAFSEQQAAKMLMHVLLTSSGAHTRARACACARRQSCHVTFREYFVRIFNLHSANICSKQQRRWRRWRQQRQNRGEIIELSPRRHHVFTLSLSRSLACVCGWRRLKFRCENSPEICAACPRCLGASSSR